MNAEEPPPSSSVRSEHPGVTPVGADGKAAAERAPAERAERILEARLQRMETYLGFRPLTEADAELILGGAVPSAGPPPEAPAEEGGIEMQIGEFWLARVGVLALSVGLAFLVAFPFAGLPALVSCLIGYAAAAAFFAASGRWAKAFPDASQILYGGALFLVYFATLRLHFFSSSPVVPGTVAGLLLVVLVVAIELYFAARRRSELMTGLVFGIAVATVVIADTPWFQLGFLAVLAAVTYALVRLRGWPALGLVAAALILLLHLDFLLNNPFLGHPFGGIAAPHGNLLALALYFVPLVAIGCRPGAPDDHVALRIGRALLVSAGSMLVALINIQLFYITAPPWVETAVAGALLLAAVAYWRHHESVYATSIYACAGNMMLSLAVYRFFPAPDFYAWLAWQSLLVAAMAVWFRSKIVIVSNLFIFAGIYLAYLLVGEGTGPVNLSFAVVALLTARILNWQKDRLAIRTEVMRNIYLGAATIVIPYGLFHTVPKAWVSASWLAAAVLYFGASAVLKSRKYRVMGISTILATIIYVFVVDLARLEPAYRIISFLVLGVVLIGVSVAYARQRRRNRESNPSEGN
ncbi:MAG: DUF2339 domain-containing protein [Opitutaceae bacterium]